MLEFFFIKKRTYIQKYYNKSAIYKTNKNTTFIIISISPLITYLFITYLFAVLTIRTKNDFTKARNTRPLISSVLHTMLKKKNSRNITMLYSLKRAKWWIILFKFNSVEVCYCVKEIKPAWINKWDYFKSHHNQKKKIPATKSIYSYCKEKKKSSC